VVRYGNPNDWSQKYCISSGPGSSSLCNAQQTHTGSVDCTNTMFGDPWGGVAKVCEFKASPGQAISDGKPGFQGKEERPLPHIRFSCSHRTSTYWTRTPPGPRLRPPLPHILLSCSPLTHAARAALASPPCHISFSLARFHSTPVCTIVFHLTQAAER
jgi:hypothetical protein